MIKGHGDDSYRYEHKIVSDFSSNIYRSQDLSALQAHLCSRIDLIHNYPEPDAGSLVKLLAEKDGISPHNIGITNGATEAIYRIASIFSGSKTAVIIPTFSEYEDACKIHSHQLFFYKSLENIPERIQLVWLCNPNNPDGLVRDKDVLERMVTHRQNTFFVFDQSYASFTNKPIWDIREAIRHKNVIVLHSMTKQQAIPGLRLGYICAHKNNIQRIEEYRMPWSINSLAIEAERFLLSQPVPAIDLDEYLAETRRLQAALSQIEGLTVFPSDTHFFLCRLANKKAADLKSYLIEQHGILIRDAANFRGLNKQFFRLATQSAKENERLVEAIHDAHRSQN
jgi:threonine-phosphate decarboxylase